ncbi:MAG: PQQ-binding-like beta-propeller repeat protein [Thermoguttaceae bacterium]|jgi:outer membrane protein assembly factor BamB
MAQYNRKMLLTTMMLMVVSAAATSAVQASDWPHWRGPFFNGSSDEKNLPSQWSISENIAWSADLPGGAAATPIVCRDRVFLAGVDAAKNTLQAMCFDRRSGKLLWQHDVAEGIQKDNRSNYASSSPVADDKLVVFFYGNGDLVCFNLDGSTRWRRNIQKDYGTFAFQWTFSSSPTLYDGKLYLPVLQRDVAVREYGLKDRENQSYLLAVDPQSGKTLWRQIRSSPAVAESRESFATAIPFEHKGQKQLLVAGGDVLSSHDPANGRELWRGGDYNSARVSHWRLVPSPVAGDGIVLVCAPKREPLYAVEADGGATVGQHANVWVSRDVKELSSDVPTPAFYDGDFFVLSDVRKSLSRVDPRSGKPKWVVGTPGGAKYEASPLAADGKIYLINFSGQVAIFSAANGKLLRVIPMDETTGHDPLRASISAAYGQLFIRTTHKLYCVGKGS